MSCKLFATCYACGTYAEVIFVNVEGQDQMICKGVCQFNKHLHGPVKCSDHDIMMVESEEDGTLECPECVNDAWKKFDQVAPQFACLLCGMIGDEDDFTRDLEGNVVCKNTELCDEQQIQRMAERDFVTDVEPGLVEDGKAAIARKERFNEWLNSSDPVLGEYLW